MKGFPQEFERTSRSSGFPKIGRRTFGGEKHVIDRNSRGSCGFDQ
jgi:hypothetical protein